MERAEVEQRPGRKGNQLGLNHKHKEHLNRLVEFRRYLQLKTIKQEELLLHPEGQYPKHLDPYRHQYRCLLQHRRHPGLQ